MLACTYYDEICCCHYHFRLHCSQHHHIVTVGLARDDMYCFSATRSTHSGALPAKRLWHYLVNEEFLQDIFIRYIFKRRVPQNVSHTIAFTFTIECLYKDYKDSVFMPDFPHWCREESDINTGNSYPCINSYVYYLYCICGGISFYIEQNKT